MTVKQLIKELQKYNQDYRVCVPGYEGGYRDITKQQIDECDIVLDVNKDWWFGPHEELVSYLRQNEKLDIKKVKNKVKAIIL